MSPITSTRRIPRFAVAVLAALVALLATTATASAAGWQYAQTDNDRLWDAVSIDRDGNGLIDDAWFDFDNDSRWDTRIFNSAYGDWLLETANFDMNENGVSEYRLLDTNQRAGFEYLYVNRNNDSYWDFRRIVPGSSADVVNRANRNIVNNTILHQFTMRTGQSLLHPTFRMP
jgi:hypothetical protein